jgi:glycosyltransferase involved in cell wall biosynthesis
MNILIVSMKFPPSIGGGETIVYNNAVSLARLGHKVSILTEKHADPTSEIEESGFNLIRSSTMNDIAAGKIDLTASLNDMAAAIRRINPDIIHVHNYQAAIAVFLTTSNLKARVVFSQYATPIPEAHKVIGYLGNYKYEESIAQFCYNSSCYDMAVEISDVYVNWALRCGASPSKVRKLYAGIDTDLWNRRPADHLLKSTLGMSRNDKVVFAPIRLVERKGALDFLEAARHLRDPRIKFLICGTVAKTDPEVRSKMESLLHDKKIMSRVIVCDEGIPLSQIARYYSIADLVCLPSHIEGLGMVLLEAMAMNIPVLATSVPGISEIVKHNVTGFMTKPHNPEMLARAIENALTVPEKIRLQVVNTAHEMVTERFSLLDQTKALVSIYDGVLSD